MAKIIVTETINRNGRAVRKERLVDTSCTFEKGINGTTVVSENKMWGAIIEESLEEVRKRINEAEAEAANPKLDLILKNQEEMMKCQKEILQNQEAILKLLAIDPSGDFDLAMPVS